MSRRRENNRNVVVGKMSHVTASIIRLRLSIFQRIFGKQDASKISYSSIFEFKLSLYPLHGQFLFVLSFDPYESVIV